MDTTLALMLFFAGVALGATFMMILVVWKL